MAYLNRNVENIFATVDEYTRLILILVPNV
jgi:hypothetical protein